ncbi:MAG: glycosyltransferase [Phycisphaerales bacterium]|nr:glycosyltransferase [Phycisphaerales bacterium]
MTTADIAIALVLDAGACALGVYWSIGLGRLIGTLRHVPPASAGLGLEPSGASACVIVPAHNEQDSIGGLVRSLRAQDHPSARFVLCLDRCTDATESRAREAAAGDPRFEIVRVDSCPPDWAGKVHAVWTGVRASAWAGSADVLVFADADTTLHPACLRSTLALMKDGGLGMLSLLSTLTCERWFERVAQPAATIEMVVQFPLVRAGRDKDRRAFANGQFMMFRRDAYLAIGGHGAVQDELLEDMALARRIAEKGIAARVMVSADMVACRMYPDWPAFQRGWKRIYTELSRQRPGRMQRNAWRTLVFGTLLPLVTIGGLAWSAGLLLREPMAPWAVSVAVCLVALALQAAVLGVTFRLARTPLWCLVVYPAGAAIVAWLLLGAARDLRRGRGIVWGGRTYAREARRTG